jgi:hypothetical protein
MEGDEMSGQHPQAPSRPGGSQSPPPRPNPPPAPPSRPPAPTGAPPAPPSGGGQPSPGSTRVGTQNSKPNPSAPIDYGVSLPRQISLSFVWPAADAPAAEKANFSKTIGDFDLSLSFALAITGSATPKAGGPHAFEYMTGQTVTPGSDPINGQCSAQFAKGFAYDLYSTKLTLGPLEDDFDLTPFFQPWDPVRKSFAIGLKGGASVKISDSGPPPASRPPSAPPPSGSRQESLTFAFTFELDLLAFSEQDAADANQAARVESALDKLIEKAQLSTPQATQGQATGAQGGSADTPQAGWSSGLRVLHGQVGFSVTLDAQRSYTGTVSGFQIELDLDGSVSGSVTVSIDPNWAKIGETVGRWLAETLVECLAVDVFIEVAAVVLLTIAIVECFSELVALDETLAEQAALESYANDAAAHYGVPHQILFDAAALGFKYAFVEEPQDPDAFVVTHLELFPPGDAYGRPVPTVVAGKMGARLAANASQKLRDQYKSRPEVVKSKADDQTLDRLFKRYKLSKMQDILNAAKNTPPPGHRDSPIEQIAQVLTWRWACGDFNGGTYSNTTKDVEACYDKIWAAIFRDAGGSMDEIVAGIKKSDLWAQTVGTLPWMQPPHY